MRVILQTTGKSQIQIQSQQLIKLTLLMEKKTWTLMYTTGSAENWSKFRKQPSEIIRFTHLSDQQYKILEKSLYNNSTN